MALRLDRLDAAPERGRRRASTWRIAMIIGRRNFLWGGAVVLGGGALGFGGSQVLSSVTSLAAESGDPNGLFPNIEMTSHEGKSYRFYDDLIKGKKVVFNFFYSGCGDVCPL